jgi:hypothetical protein
MHKMFEPRAIVASIPSRNKLTLSQFFDELTITVLNLVLSAVVLMFLWNNCLVGTIEGIHELSIIGAIGIIILRNLLFKGQSIKLVGIKNE